MRCGQNRKAQADLDQHINSNNILLELPVSTICHDPNDLAPSTVPTTNMKLEAVTICVGYSDFLAWTLPLNRAHFDRYVVVTTESDHLTREICSYYNIETVITDVFTSGGDVFNKGRGITEGLKVLDLDGWALHLDADIVLPPRTKSVLNVARLQPDSLYSLDRVNCKSFIDFIRYLCHPENMHPPDGLMRFNSFEIGSRLIDLDTDGWLPIGFFQLWHPGATGIKQYSHHHGSADRSDVLFSKRWARHRRVLLPELVALHLESEECEMGTNWNGRKSRRFGL